MSLTNFPGGGSSPSGVPITKVTMPALAEMKRQGKPISALTAYDYATSRLVDEAGIDLILVGDSLAMVVLGHDNTLAVTVDEMLHHTRAVRRAVRRALVVADMPFGSYHGTVAEGVANAVRFIKEAGAEAVKIEGPRVRAGAGAHRRGDSRGGASGPHAAERAPHGRLSRAGPQRDDRRCGCKPMRTRWPKQGPACWCWKACRARWPRRSPPSCPFPPSALAPGRIATARSWCSTTL